MKRIGPCIKCGEELFWDDDENRIDDPATMLPVCCVHEAQYTEEELLSGNFDKKKEEN